MSYRIMPKLYPTIPTHITFINIHVLKFRKGDGIRSFKTNKEVKKGVHELLQVLSTQLLSEVLER